MASITLASAGVPPKTGRSFNWLTAWALLRVSPATTQGMEASVSVCSTRGVTVQELARRSSPNQLTTSETLSQDGSSSDKSSREVSKSALLDGVFTLAAVFLPRPEE